MALGKDLKERGQNTSQKEYYLVRSLEKRKNYKKRKGNNTNF